MSTPSTRKPQAGYLLAAVGLLLAILAVRWSHLLTLPLFIDEATGLSRAGDVWRGLPYQGFMRGKFLPPILWALFRPSGPESLWLIRAVTALVALIVPAAAIRLGRAVGDWPAGLLAGVIYLVLPWAVYFDQQALADPLLAAAAGAVLVASLAQARRPGIGPTVITGVALALAVGMKFTGAILLAAPVAAAILLPRSGQRRRALLYTAIAVGVMLIVLFAVLLIGNAYLPPEESPLSPAYQAPWLTRQTSLTSGEGLFDGFGYLFGVLLAGAWYFLTPPVALAGIASLALLLDQKRRWTVTWLWVGGVLPLLSVLLASKWWAARYLSPSIPAFAALAAGSVVSLGRWFGRQDRRIGQAAGAVLTALVLVWPLPRAWTLLNDPVGADVPEFSNRGGDDRSAWSDGLAGVRATLLTEAAAQPGPIHVIYEGVSRMELAAYWGGEAGQTVGWQDGPEQQTFVARWLLDGERVAFVDTGTMPDEPHGLIVETIGVSAPYRVRIVTGTTDAMRDVLFGEAFGHPEVHAADYAALLESIPAGRTLIVYPPNQTTALQQAAGDRPLDMVTPIDEWPPTPEQVEAALGTLDGDTWTAIFFNVEAGDPAHSVERWLTGHRFRHNERWQGPVRAVDYLAGPAGFTLATLDAGVGGVATLTEAGTALADDQLYAGVTWQATSPIGPALNLGIHVLDAGGNLVAQYDGVPGGGLDPTNTWQPGQTIVDRVVIDLPADLPPGDYTVRAMLYDPASFARLPLDDGSGDSVGIGTVSVSP